jgi:hypothetical protein
MRLVASGGESDKASPGAVATAASASAKERLAGGQELPKGRIRMEVPAVIHRSGQALPGTAGIGTFGRLLLRRDFTESRRAESRKIRNILLRGLLPRRFPRV